MATEEPKEEPKKAAQGKPYRGELINATKAAKRIGVGKTWIYNRMESRTLPFPCYRCEYGKRFDTADLDDYLRIRKDSAGVAPEGIKGGAM
jgi:predicted DNA-binding transcriptional regulator AlpA